MVSLTQPRSTRTWRATPPVVQAKAAGGAALACGLGFAVTASLALGDRAVQALDQRGMYWLHRSDYGVVGDLSSLLAHLGEPLPQLALLAGAVAIGLRRGLGRQTLAAAAVVLGANLTTQLLKLALSQPRYQPVGNWVAVASTAFPSGHATALAAMTGAYLLVVPPRWRAPVAGLGAALTVAVGTAMIVLGHHFPSDAVGGVLVAGTWLFAALAVLAAAADAVRSTGSATSRRAHRRRARTGSPGRCRR